MAKKKYKSEQEDDRQDKIELEGLVEECKPAGEFLVKVNESYVLVKLSGKMRQNKIRVTMNDKVLIEVSPYDLTRGRLTRRL